LRRPTKIERAAASATAPRGRKLGRRKVSGPTGTAVTDEKGKVAAGAGETALLDAPPQVPASPLETALLKDSPAKVGHVRE
jgi:hypothetical protein